MPVKLLFVRRAFNDLMNIQSKFNYIVDSEKNPILSICPIVSDVNDDDNRK